MQNNDKHKDAYFVYISVCEKTIIMKHILYFILFVFLLNSCSRVSNVEKRQDHSTNIVDVKELVKEIVIDPPFNRRVGAPIYCEQRLIDKYRTLNIGRKICNFCYNHELNRLIMVLNDDVQFAYIDLDGLIE